MFVDILPDGDIKSHSVLSYGGLFIHFIALQPPIASQPATSTTATSSGTYPAVSMVQSTLNIDKSHRR